MDLFFTIFNILAAIDVPIIYIATVFLIIGLDRLTGYLKNNYSDIWLYKLGSIRFSKEGAVWNATEFSVLEGSSKNIRALYKFIKNDYKELTNPDLEKLVKKSRAKFYFFICTISFFFLYLILRFGAYFLYGFWIK